MNLADVNQLIGILNDAFGDATRVRAHQDDKKKGGANPGNDGSAPARSSASNPTLNPRNRALEYTRRIPELGTMVRSRRTCLREGRAGSAKKKGPGAKKVIYVMLVQTLITESRTVR